jgi:hypothetical protein
MQSVLRSVHLILSILYSACHIKKKSKRKQFFAAVWLAEKKKNCVCGVFVFLTTLSVAQTASNDEFLINNEF